MRMCKQSKGRGVGGLVEQGKLQKVRGAAAGPGDGATGPSRWVRVVRLWTAEEQLCMRMWVGPQLRRAFPPAASSR
ncbi:hypothetical protein Vlu01_11630 [Micromonospora lutea]|uniref:Uncharacterized protein n=1 Tax=Micromonospora lutea TaxID=419825 RepID=A0ABQ4IRK8_9ACTN|nr:hypothetical protein Vlu01_11630 [Micromonospora lutea]